jgi:hypothetical protein
MKIAAITHWQGRESRAALVQAIGTPPRRAGHFAELALLGAAQCASATTLPADTAVVLASHRGNRRQAEELARTVAIERTAPMPFAFVASQSGGACQVIARHLTLNGPALCLSSGRAPFERALLYAAALFQQEEAATALVGWVEETDGATDDISHWWCLDRRPHARGTRMATLGEYDAAHTRALIGTRDGVLDLDEETARAFERTEASGELDMARRVLAEGWRTGRDYRRVRAVERNRYLLLALTR